MKNIKNTKNHFLINGKIQIYKILTYFLIFAFFGWIFETTAVFVLTGHFTDRGLLFIGNDISHYIPFITGFPIIWGLPIIDMYGTAGLIIVSFFFKLKDRTILLFSLGIIAMTIFELLGSYWSQYVLHKTYWNYSNEFMNFQGRICLRSSITWGFLVLFVIKYLTPRMNNFYNKVKNFKYFKNTIIILTFYVLICMITKYYINPNIIAH